jgi:F0F1-type ATP synthase epsilon subunit
VEELEQEKIERARKAAEELVEKAKKAGADKREFTVLETSLQREIARLRVYEKYSRKRVK